MLFEKRLVVICVLLIFIQLTVAQGKVDKPCIVKSSGAKGVCKVDISCPKVQADAEKGIQPTICDIILGSIYVVCCEGAQPTNIQANENSFLHEENVNNDGIVYEGDVDYSKLSVSERNCLEYNKNAVESVGVIPLVANPKPSSILIAKCNYDGIPLVVGGQPALPGEFPFMALLGYAGSEDKTQWNCGGTLISDYYVMTAAHCIITKFGRPVLVRLGELDLSKTDDNSFPEDFGIADYRVHPKYNPISKHNDIALIKLNKQVKFNNFIRPACLWSNHDIKYQSTIATGWGATEAGGWRSDMLQKVSLDIVNKSYCDRTYGNNKYFKNGIPNTMLCAGDLKGGKDTCYGDSGGPLTVTKEDNNCIFYTVGITSFGKVCALENTPAVYTRVSEYVPWIEKIVWQ